MMNESETAKLLRYPVDRRSELSILEDFDLELPAKEVLLARDRVLKGFFDGELCEQAMQFLERNSDLTL